MKKLLLISLVSSIFINIHAQEIINLNYNSEKKLIEDKTQNIKLKKGKTYLFRVNNVNTAVMKAKLEPASYYLSSNIPEILKPIFSGISESSQLKSLNYTGLKDAMKLDYNLIYSIAQDYWDKLNLIKEYANGLYDKTKFLPDKDAANDYYKSMCVQLGLNQNNASIDSIEEKYYQYSNYIIAARDLFKGFIETNPDFIAEDQEIINYYSTISYYVEKIQGDNYYKYLQFIISSRDAKNYFTSRSLKVDKDMVELNIILIDNYKKDTLYNETLPFFSEKTCSFDFSTGFYYNNLIENSYYLEKRDSLTNNVIEEEDRKFDIAFGALGNFSYKITNKIRAGIDMGAAISPLDGKMRYLVGAHIMIGRRNQLGLNAGLAIAKLKVLSNSVKTDDTGKYVPAAVTSVPTYEKVRQGFYIGITYNLTSKKK